MRSATLSAQRASSPSLSCSTGSQWGAAPSACGPSSPATPHSRPMMWRDAWSHPEEVEGLEDMCVRRRFAGPQACTVQQRRRRIPLRMNSSTEWVSEELHVFFCILLLSFYFKLCPICQNAFQIISFKSIFKVYLIIYFDIWRFKQNIFPTCSKLHNFVHSFIVKKNKIKNVYIYIYISFLTIRDCQSGKVKCQGQEMEIHW